MGTFVVVHAHCSLLFVPTVQNASVQPLTWPGSRAEEEPGLCAALPAWLTCNQALLVGQCAQLGIFQIFLFGVWLGGKLQTTGRILCSSLSLSGNIGVNCRGVGVGVGLYSSFSGMERGVEFGLCLDGSF